MPGNASKLFHAGRAPVVVVLSLCSACAYTPGELLVPTPTRLAHQLGCLDVALSVGGETRAPAPDPVVTVELGNRCARPVHVDLSALRVDAEYPELGWRRLAVYDPAGEIRPLPIDGGGSGRENFEFVAPPGAGGPPLHVCVDAGGVAPDEVPASAQPSCFDTRTGAPAAAPGVVGS